MAIFYCSDHHFGHDNILTFNNYDGTPVRVFDDLISMHDAMIYNHNSVVKKSDTVYFLGDVAIELPYLTNLARMNGKKVLIKGNHDIFHINHYLKYFDDICGTVTVVDNFVLSHIPIHPNSISQRWKANVHGHLHGNTIKDPRYLNVSMEQINYIPIEHSQVLDKLNKAQK